MSVLPHASIIPTITPAVVDPQRVALLHLIQNQSLPLLYQLLLLVILEFPDPFHWISEDARFNLYFSLIKVPAIINLSYHFSPFWGFVFLHVYPLLLVALASIFIGLIFQLLHVIRYGVAAFLSRFIPERPKTLLEITFPASVRKSAYSTEQFFNHLHAISQEKRSLTEIIMDRKYTYSFEIASIGEYGIKFFLMIPNNDISMLERSLLSYVPGIKVKKVDDYLVKYLSTKSSNEEKGNSQSKRIILEMKLIGHFALPLQKQKMLDEYDPVSYIAGNMTHLENNEMIVFQIVTTPVLASVHKRLIKIMKELHNRIYRGEPLGQVLHTSTFQIIVSLPILSIFWNIARFTVKTAFFILRLLLDITFAFLDDSKRNGSSQPENNTRYTGNPYEEDFTQSIKEKIDQGLFETNIRILAVGQDEFECRSRLAGLASSFESLSSPYQGLTLKSSFNIPFIPALTSDVQRLWSFKNRSLSRETPFNKNPILSVSELSDLYHFPSSISSHTEDLHKTHSSELPAPLSLKASKSLDVVFGENEYGNRKTPIGLNLDDRSRNVYLLGQTGSGKTTVMFHMAKDDIQKGRGVAVIDPHGDLATDLLSTVSQDRIDDLIYFNPFDMKYPIGINLLELTPGLDEDSMELEKELVCEGVITIFRRVFSKDEHTDAHRIEYILRNTIYTAFTVKDATLFTIYDLLNNPAFQKQVIKNLEDEQLLNFWKNEFGRAGNYQIVKMVSGVTAKVGRFLFSPIAKRILEQPKSTIQFDEILNEGKILICNLAEGKLSEDTMQLLGTTIITKIHQAALRRAKLNREMRRPFYLFIDEFQNFATPSFTRILSGGRKFGLHATIAEQSTSQQENRSLINVILANVGTVICFRTASPIDEELMLTQFSPHIKKGEIANLPRYRFYIKLSAVEPEEPFSGTTLAAKVEFDHEYIDSLTQASRNNYAIAYRKPEKPKKTPGKKKDIERKIDEDVGSLV
ncbi:type IV secretion system DNA-binding domain-containing protein [Candidatus Roizmanbacteria bacterium]|nr:type IV secretion system DNA-binding domain-containing protein [Candidatus Roizmanbacteria bacterium]